MSVFDLAGKKLDFVEIESPKLSLEKLDVFSVDFEGQVPTGHIKVKIEIPLHGGNVAEINAYAKDAFMIKGEKKKSIIEFFKEGAHDNAREKLRKQSI